MKRFKQAARHGVGALMSVLVLGASLAGCGGGGSQIQPFVPTGIIAFGDETSVITAQGNKYSENAVSATSTALVCQNNPIWTQIVATRFGLTFSECNPNNLAVPQGQSFAQPGATVADFQHQLDVYFSTNAFSGTTLVTVLVGANDILALYRQFPNLTVSSLEAAATTAGANLATQVNRAATAGAKVIISTVPDQGLTPFAISETLVRTDYNRGQLLTQLTTAFNSGLRLNLINDGHMIGLVLADEMLDSAVKYPSAYGFKDVIDPACLSTVALPNCSDSTLVAGATSSTWLWADNLHFGAGGHRQLGNLAQARATNNPF
ncbi:MAG: esterase [Burkholderiaceae bacterium]|nr:esterase [Roseateles sp.]MBV8468481.1 esterase [Burkholderiaceae bacterium]